jgi:hypothetical protein
MLDIYKAPVNNIGLDPIQGFDIAAWMQDSASGQIALFGDFQSITLTIRDSTETYLPLGTRFPVYLNGEIQIAFVIEQGLVDMNFMQRTFGVQNMVREQLVTRGPRFQLTFDANAYELNKNYVDIANESGKVSTEINYRTGGTTFNQIVGGSNAKFAKSSLGGSGNEKVNKGQVPLAQGRYELQRCKIDSLSVGIMPGRRVIAQRWEGVAEGIRFIPESLQDFRSNNPDNPGPAFRGGNLTSDGSGNISVGLPANTITNINNINTGGGIGGILV